MHFSFATVLAAASLLPAFTIQSPASQLQRRDGVTCAGQNDSPPYANEVQQAIDFLRSLGSTGCGNDNHRGSHCTTMVKRGSAAIAFCGVPGISRPCDQVAGFAQNVLNQCRQGNTADGQYKTPDFYIPVFNSNKT